MNNFEECLAASHAAEDLPFWEQVYRRAFPNMVAFINHRQDGEHQRQGIDRSVILDNSKQILIDEKVRFRNKKTDKVYTDVALEYISNDKTKTPGWVCKPLMADYIAYAIAPIGVCYLLPVPQMQLAWSRCSDKWFAKPYPTIEAKNGKNGKLFYTTHSICIPPKVLFTAIGNCHRIYFDAFEEQL